MTTDQPTNLARGLPSSPCGVQGADAVRSTHELRTRRLKYAPMLTLVANHACGAGHTPGTRGLVGGRRATAPCPMNFIVWLGYAFAKWLAAASLCSASVNGSRLRPRQMVGYGSALPHLRQRTASEHPATKSRGATAPLPHFVCRSDNVGTTIKFPCVVL